MHMFLKSQPGNGFAFLHKILQNSISKNLKCPWHIICTRLWFILWVCHLQTCQAQTTHPPTSQQHWLPPTKKPHLFVFPACFSKLPPFWFSLSNPPGISKWMKLIDAGHHYSGQFFVSYIFCIDIHIFLAILNTSVEIQNMSLAGEHPFFTTTVVSAIMLGLLKHHLLE